MSLLSCGGKYCCHVLVAVQTQSLPVKVQRSHLTLELCCCQAEALSAGYPAERHLIHLFDDIFTKDGKENHTEEEKEDLINVQLVLITVPKWLFFFFKVNIFPPSKVTFI